MGVVDADLVWIEGERGRDEGASKFDLQGQETAEVVTDGGQNRVCGVSSGASARVAAPAVIGLGIASQPPGPRVVVTEFAAIRRKTRDESAAPFGSCCGQS